MKSATVYAVRAAYADRVDRCASIVQAPAFRRALTEGRRPTNQSEGSTMPVIYARVSQETHDAVHAVSAETGLSIAKVVDELLAAQLGLPVARKPINRTTVRAALQRLRKD